MITRDKKPKNKEDQLFDQLLLDPNFVKEVKEFKAKHGIPPKGFKSYKDYEKWHNQHKFTTEEVAITKEVITLDAQDKPVISNKVRANDKIGTYHLDLCRILSNHELSQEWLSFVHGFICFNRKGKISIFEVSLHRDTCEGIIIGENLNFSFGATMNLKRLFQDPTGGNIWTIDILPLQKLMQGSSEKSRRPSRSNIEVQSKVYQLTKQGKSDQEIFYSMPIIEDINIIRQYRKRFKDKTRATS